MDNKRMLMLPEGGWICVSKKTTLQAPHQLQWKIKKLPIDDFIDGCNKGDYDLIDSLRDSIVPLNDSVIFKAWKEDVDKDEIKGTYCTIPCGIYKAQWWRHFIKLEPFTILQDDYIDLDDSTTKLILDDINAFIRNASNYKALNIRHKRGILLFGPPGNGKTMIINHVVEKYKDVARIIFLGETDVFERNDQLTELREAFASELVIFVAEEATQYMNVMDREASQFMLSFLDGQDSWDNCLFLATTNYPDRLPGNLIERPSRFDRIIKIDVPSVQARRKYLVKMLGEGLITQEILERTNAYSIAYLKELCIQMKINNRPFLDILNEFEKRKKIINDNFTSIGDNNRMFG